MEWTTGRTMFLIEKYHAHPELWDPKNIFFKDRTKKNDAWDNIAKELYCDKAEAERKIKNVTGQFYRELKKVKGLGNTDTSTESVYVSRWFAYKALLFLKDKYKPEISRATKSEDDGHQQDDYAVLNNQTGPIIESNQEQDENFQNFNREKIFGFSKNKVIPRSAFMKRKSNGMASKGLTTIKNVYENKFERDEHTIYGEYIGCRIRKLRTPHAQSTVQHLIENVLYEADMGKYDYFPNYNNFDQSLEERSGQQLEECSSQVGSSKESICSEISNGIKKE